MSEPERISKRSGLAAKLLLAGAAEQPNPEGLSRTLVALGVSGVVLTTASAASGATAMTALTGASGAATAASVTGAKAVNAVSALLLAKWIGLGVVGGVGLAGAAAVVSRPAAPVDPAPLAVSPATTAVAKSKAGAPAVGAQGDMAPAVSRDVPVPAEAVAPAGASPFAGGPSARPPLPEALEVGAPLAAEVALVDGARAALAAGQSERGLAELRRYEQLFPEARLLPEVLFLRIEACERLGRRDEARLAAARLVEGFPKSPHVARARKLLGGPAESSPREVGTP